MRAELFRLLPPSPSDCFSLPSPVDLFFLVLSNFYHFRVISPSARSVLMVTVLTISVTLAAFFTNSLVTGGWCARRCVAGRA